MLRYGTHPALAIFEYMYRRGKLFLKAHDIKLKYRKLCRVSKTVDPSDQGKEFWARHSLCTLHLHER
jgi:hypothetical protein